MTNSQATPTPSNPWLIALGLIAVGGIVFGTIVYFVSTGNQSPFSEGLNIGALIGAWMAWCGIGATALWLLAGAITWKPWVPVSVAAPLARDTVDES